MINSTLFKYNIKSNYKIVMIFMAVLAMYLSMMVGMYNPDTQALDEMIKLLPKEIMDAVGFNSTDNSLTGFLVSYFYGFLILLFPMVFDIIIANKLVSKLVDRGAMAYVLATPNTRGKIVATQALFMLTGVTTLIAFVTVLGIIVSESMFSGKLDIGMFILINFGALLLHFAISGIAFLSSCIFNDTKNSLAFGAGIPIAFFLIQMLANSGEKLEALKYATVFTLYNPQNILNKADGYILCLIALAVISIATYTVGILIFKKRDLPL